jgi:bacillithiol system protein YtxJ
MAKSRLERDWELDIDIAPFYLDLLKNREISNKISVEFNIIHQSPQVLLISNEKCEYSSTHNDISFSKIKEKVL